MTETSESFRVQEELHVRSRQVTVVGIARANALQAKVPMGADADTARVRALTVHKDFLSLWKEADPDVAVYKAAKAEYPKML